MSKAALDQLTRTVALEVASRGVRVNAVNPGVIITEIHKRGGMEDEAYKKVSHLFQNNTCSLVACFIPCVNSNVNVVLPLSNVFLQFFLRYSYIRSQIIYFVVVKDWDFSTTLEDSKV